MSTRLQVVLDEEELAQIRRMAEAQRQSVSDWVRQVLRAARREYPSVESGRKVQVVREAATHRYPSGDMVDLLREIESGYAGEDNP
jgi:hypothetical protein